jgi:excisionase family DNA binding protein
MSTTPRSGALKHLIGALPPSLQQLPPTLSVRQTAELAHVTDRTVRRWLHFGLIRSSRTQHAGSGRVLLLRDDVLRFLGLVGV